MRFDILKRIIEEAAIAAIFLGIGLWGIGFDTSTWGLAPILGAVIVASAIVHMMRAAMFAPAKIRELMDMVRQGNVAAALVLVGLMLFTAWMTAVVVSLLKGATNPIVQ